MIPPKELKERIKVKSKQSGFILAGVTSSESLAHYAVFRSWLDNGYHADMQYLANKKRADPKLILPECKSILVLALPYHIDLTGFNERRINPIDSDSEEARSTRAAMKPVRSGFQIASYALGADYHEVIPPKLKQIVEFIEEQLGYKIPNRYYTDSGPILERELAQRAGLGWIGKNSALINPKLGSTFFLAEILLGVEIEPDEPFHAERCGACERCITACPMQCILPNRTLDARRCISYLTIENKGNIPEDLRPLMQDWIFGCDICQQVCPWNRFSLPADISLTPKIALPIPSTDMLLSPAEFNQRFKKSPVKRAKRRGYLRNLAVAIGNRGSKSDIPVLEEAAHATNEEPLVQEHVKWAVEKIKQESASRRSQ